MVISAADVSQRSEDLRRKKSVDRLFTTFGRATALLGGCIALLFAWIKLRNLPMPSLQNADPILILHFFLALAFASYMLAVRFEIGIHKSVYVDDPLKGRMTPDIAASMLLMSAGAALLFWTSHSETYFPAAVLFFIFTDVVLWRRTAGRFAALSAYDLPDQLHSSGHECKGRRTIRIKFAIRQNNSLLDGQAPDVKAVYPCAVKRQASRNYTSEKKTQRGAILCIRYISFGGAATATKQSDAARIELGMRVHRTTVVTQKLADHARLATNKCFR